MYETQQDRSEKIIYAASTSHDSTFHTNGDQDFSCLEKRLCSAALLMWVRADYLPYTFSSWPEASDLIGWNYLNKGLTDLVPDTPRTLRGWLGQSELIYRSVGDYGFNAWGRAIDPLRKTIIRHVEEPWISLRSAIITGPPGAEFLPPVFSSLSTDLRDEWATRRLASQFLFESGYPRLLAKLLEVVFALILCVFHSNSSLFFPYGLVPFNHRRGGGIFSPSGVRPSRQPLRDHGLGHSIHRGQLFT